MCCGLLLSRRQPCRPSLSGRFIQFQIHFDFPSGLPCLSCRVTHARNANLNTHHEMPISTHTTKCQSQHTHKQRSRMFSHINSYYCPESSVQPTLCPGGGTYCPSQSRVPKQCPSGCRCPKPYERAYVCDQFFYCPIATEFEIPCPSGYLCPVANLSSAMSCPQGFFCATNVTQPSACPLGRFCATNSPFPTPCPIDEYTPSGS